MTCGRKTSYEEAGGIYAALKGVHSEVNIGAITQTFSARVLDRSLHDRNLKDI